MGDGNQERSSRRTRSAGRGEATGGKRVKRGETGGTLSYSVTAREEGKGAREGKEGRSEKSSAAYVGFRARLAATAAAAALIRVRRYEIIKLGLDGGEGDGVSRGEGRRRVRKEGKETRGKKRRGRVGCRRRWNVEGARAPRGKGNNRIPYTGI